MKETDIYSELTSIRSLMERSSKFISLSGLSGVMAGIYALIGAFIAYKVINTGQGDLTIGIEQLNDPQVVTRLVMIALAVLVLSVLTCLVLSQRQSKKKGQQFLGSGSKRLFSSLALPLLTGGIFVIILLAKAEYSLIVPACLIFYGLALVSGSQYTFSDVKWLGFCQISLGLLCTFLPGYALLFWIIGFGVLHILYGSIMHFKYKQ